MSCSETNWLKENFDGAFHKTTRHGGWRFVIRDHMGDQMAAGAGRLENMRDALHVEAEGMQHAIQAASSLGMGRLIFETDCSELKQALMATTVDFAPNRVLFHDLRNSLRLNLISMK